MSDEQQTHPHWSTVKLPEVAYFQEGPGLRKFQYRDSGIPFLNIRTLADERVDKSKCQFLDPAEVTEKYTHFLVDTGDIICSSSGTIGKTAIIQESDKPLMLNTSIIRFRPVDEEIISHGYIHIFLKSQNFLRQAHNASTGSAQVNFGPSHLRNFTIPLPPLPEQKRIVAKIEELFSELEAGEASLRKARRQLGVYRQSLLKQAFEGKLTQKWRTQNPDKLESPASLLARIQSARQSRHEQQLKEWETQLTEWKQADKSGDRPSKPREPELPDAPSTEHNRRIWDLPTDWMWTQLGCVSFVTKLAGFEYTDYVRYHEDGDLKVLKAENAGPDGFRKTEFSRIKSETVSALTRSIIHGGELLVVFVGAGTGNVARVPLNQAFFLGPNIAMARPDSPETDTRFVELFLRSPMGHDLLLAASKAVAQPSLSMGTIRQVPIPLCSLPEQQEIVRLLDEQFEAIERNERELDAALKRSEALRQSILKKAFAGRLVPQDPADEPAAQLLARLRTERELSDKSSARRRTTKGVQ